MAQVNPLTREVLIKLVYYGPGLGGKTTTLQRVHAVSPAETRGKIVSLATPVDRTLYFDFLPLRIGPINGYPVRLQLFTVPGQVYFNATRKLVLTGADGIVFVADSQRERQDANLESLQNLKSNLAEQSRQLRDIPHVLQLNKRDLPNVVTTEQLAQALNEYDAPVFESSAAKGEGVLEPLDELVRLVLDDLDRRAVFGDSGSRASHPSREPSFTPATEGLGESLSRASEELWQASVHPPAGVRKSEPPEEGPPRPATPPPAQSTHATLTDQAPVDLTQPLASEPPPSQELPTAVPHTMADAVPPNLADAMPSARAEAHSASPAPLADPAPSNGTQRPHSSVPTRESSAAPRAASFRPQTETEGGVTVTGPGPSWAELFTEALRDSVVELEAELTGGEPRTAVLRCESLAAELLAGVASRAALPVVERQPLSLAMALGLSGERWLWLCRLAARAKQGEPVSHAEALDAYAAVLEIRRLAVR